MKRILVFRIWSLALLLLISAGAIAQQSTPPLILNDKKLPGGKKMRAGNTEQIKTLQAILEDDKNSAAIKGMIEKKVDSLKIVNKVLYKIDSAATTAEDEGSVAKVRFFGMGDVNTQSLTQLNAAGRLSANLVLYDRKDRARKVISRAEEAANDSEKKEADKDDDAKDRKKRFDPKDKEEEETEEEEEYIGATQVLSRAKKNVRKRTNVLINSQLSFNAAAVNDTLIQGVILFPALGSSGFQGSVEAGTLWDSRPIDQGNWYVGAFGEFVTKRVNMNKKFSDTTFAGQDTAIAKRDTSVYFHVNNVTLGLKFAWYYRQAPGKPMISFTGLAYYNLSHIPGKDTGDFHFILAESSKAKTMPPNTFHSIGAKITLGVDNLQFFADMRHTFHDRRYVGLDRQLTSFNTNIGVILPIEFKIGKGD